MSRPNLVAAVAALLAACSSHAPSTGPDDAPVSMGDGPMIDADLVDALSAYDACTTLAAERCAMLGSCSPADLTKQFGSAAECLARETLSCQRSLGAADTGATPAGMVACGSALVTQACADFLGPGGTDECRFAGSGNGTCAFEAQCETEFCALGAHSACGVCAAPPSAGTSCAASGCGSNLVCDGNNDLCEAAVGSGAACNKTTPCDHGLACVGDTNTTNGTCRPQGTTAGAACDPTRRSAPTCNNDDGLTCNQGTDQCAAQPLAAAGSACGLISNVETACTAGASCVIPTSQTQGTCVAPAADGSACNIGSAGPDCLFPARCIVTSGSAGTCELPDSAGC